MSADVVGIHIYILGVYHTYEIASIAKDDVG